MRIPPLLLAHAIGVTVTLSLGSRFFTKILSISNTQGTVVVLVTVCLISTL